jgi:predicted regulator of Ras-like GTPase activity (Roadblock/LC7/MglB family)
MMFRENIQKLVNRLDGCVAGALMGFDGITVASHVRDGQPGQQADIQTWAMEYGHVVAQLRPATQRLELGALREIAIRTDKLVMLFFVLTNDYYVCCALLPTANVGKARYLVKLASPQIRAELH